MKFVWEKYPHVLLIPDLGENQVTSSNFICLVSNDYDEVVGEINDFMEEMVHMSQ